MALEQRIDAIGKPERKIKRKRKDEEDVSRMPNGPRDYILSARWPTCTTRKSVTAFGNGWNEQLRRIVYLTKPVYQLPPN
jgi:hypothetical protein